jgi:hypothetical protein
MDVKEASPLHQESPQDRSANGTHPPGQPWDDVTFAHETIVK